MEQKKRGSANVGTATLILIFVTLALVSFSVLTLTSANAQRRLEEKMEQRSSACLEAENQAQEELARIRKLAGEWEEKTADEAEFEEALLACVAQETGLAGQADAEGCRIGYQIPVSDSQSLAVQLQVCRGEEQPQITVIQWQIITVTDWDNSQTLTLYQ